MAGAVLAFRAGKRKGVHVVGWVGEWDFVTGREIFSLWLLMMNENLLGVLVVWNVTAQWGSLDGYGEGSWIGLHCLTCRDR